jgi:hypothetical protein
MRNHLILAFFLAATVLLCACSRDREPFTAEMRFQVDSVSSARIRDLRTQIDSQCAADQRQLLPVLADSIYKVRKAQMEAKLKEFKVGQ